MQLTAEQNKVITEVLKFKKQITTVAGFAGTGKTSIIKYLAEQLPTFAVCAYTGKAANVLRRKGIESSTIHKLIYIPFPFDDTFYFELAPALDFDGIIVDEASMVSKEIHEDLISFGLPIIFVGDHGQLPPIGNDVNLMAKPDFALEEIHRNAGEIAYFAEHIRKGKKPETFSASKKVSFISQKDMKKHLTNVDQVICAFNKTRVGLNMDAKKQLLNSGRLTPIDGVGNLLTTPLVDDKIMCLRNNYRNGLFNGMQGIITETNPDERSLKFDFYGETFDVDYDHSQFMKERYDFSFDKEDPDPFDFAYAISCHKSQGDQWEKVMVMEQKCDKWDMKRWNYTAASRAMEQLLWIAAK